MPEIRVQDEQGNTHVFPDGSTPEMIAKVLNVKPPQTPTPLPISTPEQTKPGFLGALGSDIQNVVPQSWGDLAKASGMGLVRASTLGASDLPSFIQSFIQRRRAGNSIPYALGASEAEGLGANVRGQEQSASQGDIGGVLGHAAMVPLTIAMGELFGRGLRSEPVKSLSDTVASKMRNPATSIQSQRGLPGTVKNILPKGLQKWSIPEGLIPKGRLGTPTNPGPYAEIPLRVKPPGLADIAERDATRQNVPFAGEEITPTEPTVNDLPWMPRPLRPVVGTPEEFQAYDNQMSRLKQEASDAGMYSAARGKVNKKLNYQQRIGSKLK